MRCEKGYQILAKGWAFFLSLQTLLVLPGIKLIIKKQLKYCGIQHTFSIFCWMTVKFVFVPYTCKLLNHA